MLSGLVTAAYAHAPERGCPLWLARVATVALLLLRAHRQ